ncbi:MAG: hypothetical protein KC549_18275, partial [Myxococcales bacterium]|nr:hypothetical protein [Myxococcales bacterium]
ILHPYAQRPTEASVYVGWAGQDHLQQAQALAALYLERKDVDGWPTAALVPFLTALDEVLPWVHQWHGEPDERFGGQRMGETFEAFLVGQLAALGLERSDVRAWAPAATGRLRKGKA